MKKILFLNLVLGLIIFSCSAQQKTLEIVVHRGANNLAPENTMAATQKCIDLGVEYVEIDVRMSKDSVFYILHDRTLNRTTNGSGMINAMHSKQIDQLDAGSWFSDDFKGEKVPRLDTYLNEIKGKIKVYFDVKDADLERLISLVYKSGFQDDCFFWFSSDKKAKQFRELDEYIPLKMNIKNIGDVTKIMSYNPQLIECGIELITPEIVKACKDNNLKIMVNALHKNAEKDYQKIIDSQADMVNLDKPDIMIEEMN